jgi:hypothetical protein
VAVGVGVGVAAATYTALRAAAVRSNASVTASWTYFVPTPWNVNFMTPPEPSGQFSVPLAPTSVQT